jgi:hypothetical protein
MTCTDNDQIYDYLNVYCVLTRVAVKTDRSGMTAEVHRDFMTIINRAQMIVRLEAEQAGLGIEGVIGK